MTTAILIVVLGCLSVGIGTTALRDWRTGRRDNDAATLAVAVQLFWAALLFGALSAVAFGAMVLTS